MKKRTKLLLGTIGVLLIVVICCIIYSNHQKSAKYSYQLVRVKGALEQIVQYSERCIAVLSSSGSDEKHGDLMMAVNTLDFSISKIGLLHNEGSLSRYIFELSDHLNGTYPNLPNDTKIYWLNSIKDASEKFLSALEQNPTLSFYDFRIVVLDYSSALPTYEAE